MQQTDALSGMFLFKGMTEAETAQALEIAAPETKIYRRGEKLCGPEGFHRGITVLLRGECDVLQAGVTINTLGTGDVFGVLTLFSEKESFPTVVTARRETEAVLIPVEAVREMMARWPQIAVNLAVFLTGRIEFLNERVAALTMPGVEKRLAAHLLKLCPAEEGILLNRKHTAEMLGCGRASLYRALDALESRGLIAWRDKRLVIVDRERMERME